jgi:hypothetical protein
MRGYGPAEQLLGDQPVVMVEATNVGQSKTTLTHLVGFHHKSWWHRLFRRKAATTFVVPDPRPGVLPHVLDIGERWVGIMEQNEDLVNMSRNGYLYVGVYHSTGRRPALQRLIVHPTGEA